MEQRNYQTKTYPVDHTTYGGRICQTDFETDYKRENRYGSRLAQRIISDWSFDEQCRRNGQSRLETRRDDKC